MFPQGSPTLLQASPGSGEKNHLEIRKMKRIWRSGIWLKKRSYINITLAVQSSSYSSRWSTSWSACWFRCGLDYIVHLFIYCSFKEQRPGPCIREHANLEVGLAKRVCSHQGDHLEKRVNIFYQTSACPTEPPTGSKFLSLLRIFFLLFI